MGDWRGIRLEGRRVVLEPLAETHEDGLWEASREPQTWRWLSIPQPATRDELRRYLDEALAAADAGVLALAGAVLLGAGLALRRRAYH